MLKVLLQPCKLKYSNQYIFCTTLFLFFFFYVQFLKINNQLKYYIGDCWSRPHKLRYLLFRDSLISA